MVEFHREQDLFDYFTTQQLPGVVAVDGFDGAGKTTLAQKISRHCNLPFLDLNSILLGPKRLNYIDRIDYKRLTNEIAAQKKWINCLGCLYSAHFW